MSWAEPILDTAILESLAAQGAQYGDPELVRAVLEDIMTHFDARLDALERAPDLRALRDAAHRVKGAMAQVGAARLAALAGAIEVHARAGSDEAFGLLPEVRSVAEATRVALAQRLEMEGKPVSGV